MAQREPTSESHPDSVCAVGSCVWTDAEWRCLAPPEGKSPGAACDPDAFHDDYCPADTFCRDDRLCFPQGLFDGMCSRGITQGSECDSDWTNPGCRPCVYGSQCVDAGEGEFCHQPCEDAGQCPCDDPRDPYGCVDGLCYPCEHFGEPCDGEHKCCDPGTMCGGSGVCCYVDGMPCSSSDQCCDSKVCWPTTGSCAPCVDAGEAGCLTDEQCCHGASCLDGVCYAPCEPSPGEPCDTGLPGPCGQGVVAYCDPVEGAVCQPLYFPLPEQCDGFDNDCDGTVDEEVPGAGEQCNKEEIIGCQDSFTARGVRACIDGAMTCDATGRFCGIGQGSAGNCGAVTVDNQYCGQCWGQPCSMQQLCDPNVACRGEPGNWVCQDHPECPCLGCADLACWNPSQVGSCDPSFPDGPP